jgi:subtilisin
MRGRLAILLTAISLVGLMVPAAGAAASGAAPGNRFVPAPAGAEVVPGSYIVVLSAGHPSEVAADHARAYNASVTHVYRHALRGYAARMSPQAAANVARDPRVSFVEEDRVVTTAHHQCGHVRRGVTGSCGSVSGTVTAGGAGIVGATVTADGRSTTTDSGGAYRLDNVTPGSVTVTATMTGYTTASVAVTVSEGLTTTADLELAAEGTSGGTDPTPDPEPSFEVPTGVKRINWLASSALSSGVLATKNYPGVAVIDTGIALNHPDLNVVGGRNCSTGSSYNDGNGHGTHVAGTVAAKGAIVGVAPGAPLYAVRVLNNAGSGSWSNVICGVDWVTANGPGTAANIKVANMSLGGSGTAGNSCDASSLRRAICNSVTAGVTYVVAAGNSASDAAGFVPAAYPEVITVAAIADFNGLAGGGAAPTCRTDVDDTHANFSNYGTATSGAGHVDITAPGVCIYSTWHSGSGYNTISGTSMSSPHVAGAAVLYLAGQPTKNPDQVRGALVTAAIGAGSSGGYSYTWSRTEDLPGSAPKLLNVFGF